MFGAGAANAFSGAGAGTSKPKDTKGKGAAPKDKTGTTTDHVPGGFDSDEEEEEMFEGRPDAEGVFGNVFEEVRFTQRVSKLSRGSLICFIILDATTRDRTDSPTMDVSRCTKVCASYTPPLKQKY